MSCAAARYDRQKVHVRSVPEVGVPKGIRTPVTAVKGRCPGPLDDGDTAAPRQAGAEDYTACARRTMRKAHPRARPPAVDSRRAAREPQTTWPPPFWRRRLGL